MNKEIAFAWADELESGRHTQGFQALEYEENGATKRCCLGVRIRMCDLSDTTITHEEDPNRNRKVTVFDGRGGLLPEKIMVQSGIETHSGYIWSLKDRDDNVVTLAQLNDEGLTFSQIADVIRYFYEDL